MSRALGFSGSPSPTSLAEACKLAWHTFYGMQKASEDFENLRFEVWTIAISLDSLHSVGSTSLLIDRQPDHKRWALTFSKILTSLNAALRPLYNLVKLYLSTSTRDRTAVKQWLTNTDMNYEGLTVQDFRRKLSMLVESLNVFLSSLTHAELTRARAASETEEYRVLSEVTRNVLQKWDQSRVTGASHDTDRAIKSIETVTFVSDNVKENNTSSTRGDSTRPRTQDEYPTLWPTHQRPEYHSGPGGHAAEALNLDGIETGFRKHMNAMRRIREQLRLQKENEHHLTEQKSSHFPEVHGEVPITPITSSHHRTMPENPTAALSELASDHGYTSSSGTSSAQTSESGSVISGAQEENRPRSPAGVGGGPPPPTTANHTRSSSGELGRKRVRTQDLHLANDSDDWQRHRRPRKTALEEMLTAALFFDS
ncbi:hypothetical protein AYO20_03363 [Fonsecaea nubica]|uniref:Fungal N-terminal domain-containing protein n=1 Tax=Fonsecaea nubica TaxID=856822 RepID=A0A178D829_9EURO|nr:hypothetical protein AYO20_03363 [Fonsecaea nubica]OAL37514.1 hypothetical protein AYO20_03363 [Fonsecaea nubica]